MFPKSIIDIFQSDDQLVSQANKFNTRLVTKQSFGGTDLLQDYCHDC